MPSTVGIGRRNPKHLNLNLNLCFSNFMCPLTLDQSPPSTPTHHHQQQQQLQHHDMIDHNRPSSSTTATSSSSIMIKNFNSLYDHHHHHQHRTLPFEHYSLCSSSLSFTSFEAEPEPADFATAFASQRFFFSSPGRSNSIIESTNTDTDFTTPPLSSSSSSSLTATMLPPPPTDEHGGGDNDNNDDKKNKKKKKEEEEEEEEEKQVFFNGSVAVPTYSPDPYADFLRSMQEMVEARPELMDVKSNWDVLQELLLCYLALNPKNTHKFILSAFADLLVSLMSFSSSPPPSNSNADDFAGGGGAAGC